MKHAQGFIGALLGTVVGAVVVVAALDKMPGAAAGGNVEETVRQVIKNEPQLIMESVSNWQRKQQEQKSAEAGKALQDPALNAAVHDTKDTPFIGDANSTRTVVEFFDYNCPACKMQFTELEKLHKQDKGVKIIFKEYPIFGEQSETNSKIGIAVHRLYSEKYFAWHTKMMGNKGRTDEATALQYASELGMDAAKVKAEAGTEEVANILAAERELGQKLNIQGTPSLVIGNELVPHAMMVDQLKEKLAD